MIVFEKGFLFNVSGRTGSYSSILRAQKRYCVKTARLMIIRKFEQSHDVRIYSLSDKCFSSKVSTKAFGQVQEHHKKSLV